MASNALALVQNPALTVRSDADVYRLAALVLSTLDRLGCADTHEISRIRVIGRRVVIFDLPFLSYYDAATQVQLGAILTHLAVPQLIAVRPAPTGSLVIVDLVAPSAPRRTRSSLVWCATCGQLAPYDHTH